MALSFSRPDPSSPSAVASATFTTARRGFDPNEVRDFMRMVAAELARLQEREKFLEREVRTLQRGVPTAAVALDEEIVTRMLGEEAARILSTAREASSQIRVRAEEGSARMLREATDEAQRVREESAVEAARRRQDASSDAEAELQMAKQQGREMVNEARAYRERVLSELARRREIARQQIEQLLHGRDRLLQAFERARLVSVDVMAELTPLGEPSEYVNLAPITGPVPVMVPADKVRLASAVAEVAQIAETAAAERAAVADDVAVVAAVAAVDGDTKADSASVAGSKTIVQLRSGSVSANPAVQKDSGRAAKASAKPNPVENDTRPDAPVVALFAGEMPEQRPAVDDLFARLRAARLDQVATNAVLEIGLPDTATETAAETETETGAAAETETVANVAADQAVPDRTEELAVFQPSPEAPKQIADLDDSAFGRRDAALTPIIVGAARRMKRVLADEQNEVLAALRRNDQIRTLDTLLPWQADHVERYTSAIEGDLEQAAVAGAASVSSDSAAKHLSAIKSAKALKPAHEVLTTMLVEPLRARLERAVGEAGDNEELGQMARSIYREWKTQRIDEHLEDVVRYAFGRGQLAVIAPGRPVCWLVDPNGPACPDAEDNSLAGFIDAGQPFPTDHTFAPAHAGCRCLLAPAQQ